MLRDLENSGSLVRRANLDRPLVYVIGLYIFDVRIGAELQIVKAVP